MAVAARIQARSSSEYGRVPKPSSWSMTRCCAAESTIACLSGRCECDCVRAHRCHRLLSSDKAVPPCSAHVSRPEAPVSPRSLSRSVSGVVTKRLPTTTGSDGTTSTTRTTHYELTWQRGDGSRQSHEVSWDLYDRSREGVQASLQLWRGQVVGITVDGRTDTFSPSEADLLGLWLWPAFIGLGIALWGLLRWWDGWLSSLPASSPLSGHYCWPLHRRNRSIPRGGNELVLGPDRYLGQPRQMPSPVRRVGHESCSACCQYGQEWVPNTAYRTVGRRPATRINPSTVRVQASAPSSRLIAPARSSG